MSSHPELAAFDSFGAGGFSGYIGDILRDPLKGPGDARRFAFLPEARHLNGGGALHGGLLMTLVDNILGFTAHEAAEGRMSSTVTLNTDFLSGGVAGEPVWGRAQATRKTRSLIFVAGELTQQGRTVMTASGIWKVIGA